MFMGEYNHTIDEKGRIVIPARFRDSFGSHLVVTKGFEGSLNIYQTERFDKIAEGLSALSDNKKDNREYKRLFISKAIECEIDSQNRINLSATLIKAGNLTKQCVFVGSIDHLELWSLEAWKAWYDAHDDRFEEVAENLTQIND